MLNTVTGFGTRSSVRRRNLLNVSNSFKGTVIFKRYSSTQSSVSELRVDITQELEVLKANSIKKNVKIVSTTVHKLLAFPEFWIHCYESIKSNPGTSALGGGVNGQKPETLDGLDKDFFDVLSKKIITGKFQFGATRQTFIPKGNGGKRSLGIADSRDKIVQKGMAIILEITAEHRFYENSFGFRRNKSAHDAISFIKKKVPSGT